MGTRALGARVLLAGVLGEGGVNPWVHPTLSEAWPDGVDPAGANGAPGWQVLGCDLASPKETQAPVYDPKS